MSGAARGAKLDPVLAEALETVRDALERAIATGRRNANAMTLATVDADGTPSVRTVLARLVDARGITFYTDGRSRKGRALAADRRVAACFYWEPIEEQASIEGVVRPVAANELAADFTRRPSGGRALVHASVQSAAIASDEALRARVSELTERDREQPLPVPGHWRGYRIVASRIEHWQGRRDRVHTRTLYVQRGDRWIRERLSP